MSRRAFYGWAGPQEYMWVSKDPRQLFQRAQLKVSTMANLWYFTTGLVLVRSEKVWSPSVPHITLLNWV